MDLVKLQDDKDFLEFEIQGEDHTFCNLLRFHAWKEKGIEVVSYNIKHPLVGHPVFAVKGKAPKKILGATIDSLKKEIKEIKDKFKKLK